MKEVDILSNHYYSEKPTVKSDRKTIVIEVRGSRLNIVTDAGVFSKTELDYGTKLLLESLDVTNAKGAILDVGCGYGPIGLSIAKEDDTRDIWMVDVNERAIELSELNKKNNGIINAKIFKSYLLNEVGEKQFAYIITNPPIRAGKKVVHELFEQASSRLLNNGELWIVIQKKQGAPSAITKLKELFDDVAIVEKSKGYFVIRAKKSVDLKNPLC